MKNELHYIVFRKALVIRFWNQKYGVPFKKINVALT